MKLSQIILAALLWCCLAVAGLAQTAHPPANQAEGKVDVAFKDADVKEAIKSLGRQLKLNVVFDESVRVNAKLDLELKDVTLEATLKIIFVQHRLRASWIETNTIYVYADVPQLRERFAGHKV